MGILGGQTFGAPFGDPGQTGAVRARIRRPGAASVRVAPATGYGGQWWGIYVASRRRAVVYVEEGSAARASVALAPGGGRQAVCVLPHGFAQDADHYRAARELETSDRATLEWTWPVDVIGALDGSATPISELSGWDLSGLTWAHLTPRARVRTRGDLSLSLSVDGSTAAVTLSAASGTLASGSGSVGGTVSLSAVSGSGVSGSVTVDSGAASASGVLLCRVPAQMRILRDTSDPPSTTRATVAFRGRSRATWTEPDALSSATHYYALEPVSDTGAAGTASASVATTISAPPSPPTELAYDSGDAAATVLSWTVSPTTGATYRAYVQGIGEEVYDMSSPAATAAAGATSLTLPAISGYPGRARVILRAVGAGGVEEQNGAELVLEYDASGDYIAPRPNVAALTEWSVSAGITLSVDVSYDPTDEAAAPATVALYARDLDGSYDYATPAATGALSAVDGSATRTATLIASLSAGLHAITARALTDAGVDSGADAPEQTVYLSGAAEIGPAPVITQSGG